MTQTKNRTNIDYSKHILDIVSNEHVKIHHLTLSDSSFHNVKFINCGGVMAVTGDFGNWIFCRQFVPDSKTRVSDGYWLEKLVIASTQKPYDWDDETVQTELEKLLYESGELTEDEETYIKECIDRCYDKNEYVSYAYQNGTGQFNDYSEMPYHQKPKFWILAVFDAFDEICERLED